MLMVGDAMHVWGGRGCEKSVMNVKLLWKINLKKINEDPNELFFTGLEDYIYLYLLNWKLKLRKI